MSDDVKPSKGIPKTSSQTTNHLKNVGKILTQNNKGQQPNSANDSMTVGYVKKSLTTAHYKQQLQNQQTSQGKSSGNQAGNENSQSTSQSSDNK